MSDRLYILVPLLMIVGFGFVFENSEIETETKSKSLKIKNDVVYPYIRMKDTFYLLGEQYVKVSLKDQTATVYFRNDSSVTYKISSGNGNISKGIFTPTGFYTVQSKSPKALSKQFDDAELFNWVGFNVNIGFHGLAGSGYYNHLGRRPSSHGCIRISREDGAKLYKQVQLGTPVIVVSDEPAVEFKFANVKDIRQDIDFIFQSKDKATSLFFKDRMKAVYEGDFYTKYGNKIFFDGNKIVRNKGIDIGLFENVPYFQKEPLNAFNTVIKYSDKLIRKQPDLFLQKHKSAPDTNNSAKL